MFSLKKYLPKSLLGRSILIIVTPAVLTQVVATWVFYDRHWETVTRRLAASVAGEISSVIDQRQFFSGAKNESWIIKSAKRSLALDIQFQRGKIFPNRGFAQGESLIEKRLSDALRERVRRPFRIEIDSLPRTVSIFVQLPDGVLEARVHEERLFSSTTYIFIMWMVGTSLLLFAIATVFMKNQLRPITRLTGAVDAFGKGRDVPDFKPEGATEIRQAAAAFSLMRARVLRSIEQRTDMLSGVSHDLRTPLTRIKLQLAMLHGSDEILALEQDVSEMEKLVEEYLSFARGDSTESTEVINLREFLEDIASKTASEKVEIEVVCNRHVHLELRPTGFRRCISNLINNSATYGSQIKVQVIESKSGVTFHIDDDGPGIPEAARNEVFRPFTRLESERPPDIGGTGLGLTIARDIVLSHGGSIDISDSPIGGARIRIKLPA